MFLRRLEPRSSAGVGNNYRVFSPLGFNRLSPRSFGCRPGCNRHLDESACVTAAVGAVTAHETPNETPRCRSARERHAIELMALAGQLSGLSTRAVKPGLQRLTGAAGAPVVQPTEWVEQPLSRDVSSVNPDSINGSGLTVGSVPTECVQSNPRRAGRGVILTMLPTTVRRGGQPNCGSTDEYTAARG
ncbi:hypothetical protein PGTUg99_036838 [Puccinia graminis f. sp. tritici]|uniref:Uncharacterized protein n=1 Tax=Puccinia graminis f. sp. tritici TaxID=56615 RepID=A0A5B0SMR5_PUCGR|nr:hypothetical protein PGTUg99_036838 [Puccinia graminis f. sp. tritici]